MKYKILLMCLILGIMMSGIISAADFDNRVFYQDNNLTARIENWFGIGEILGYAELTSHHTTTEKLGVFPGKNRVVMTYNFTDWNAYPGGLGNVKITNLKTGEILTNKSYYFATPIYSIRSRPIFQEQCSDVLTVNGTEHLCNQEIRGYENITELTGWQKMANSNIPAGNSTISLITDVDPGDYMDGVWTVAGQSIDRHAVWDDALTAGLQAYWTFNQSTGSNIPDAFNGTYNLTAQNMSDTDWKAGLINNTLDFGHDGLANQEAAAQTTLGNLSLNYNNGSISLWINFTNGGSREEYVMGRVVAGNPEGDFRIIKNLADDKLAWGIRDNAGTFQEISSDAAITNDGSAFVHTVVEWGDNGTRMYLNGVLQTQKSASILRPNRTDWCLGGARRGGNCQSGTTIPTMNGSIEEMGIWNRSLSQAEVTQLYNGGAGITFTRSTDSAPTVTLNQPANNSAFINANVTFNCTATDDIKVENLSLILDGFVNYTVSPTPQNVSFEVGRVMAQGVHLWDCLAADGANPSQTTYGGQQTYTVDSIPPNITLLSPANQSTYVTFDPTGQSVQINVSEADNVALGSCWYNFNNGSGNISLGCGNNLTKNYGSGWHHVTFFVNDTLGFMNKTAVSFFVNVVNWTMGYDPTVIEGNNHTVYFNITATNASLVSANLSYNSTVYPMTIASSNSTSAKFQNTLTAPFVSSDTIVKLQINASVSGTLFNTSVVNQTVYNVPALNVSGIPCSPASYNFTLFDETNLTDLGNGTFDYNFVYGNEGNNTLSYNYGEISGSTDFYVCANLSISTNWTIGRGEIFYVAPGHVDRRYYLFTGSTLTNITNNVSLYDLLTSEQTSFILEVEDTSLSPYVEKFTSLLRWYPNLNDYLIVDMGETDENGDTVIHVDVEDIDYRVAAYEQNGSLIKLADPTRFTCLVNPCTYTLKISPGSSDYTSFFGVDYNFTYNATNGMWSFVYSDTTQKTSAINLTIYKITGTDIYSVCSDNASGYTGVLSCNTSAYSGTLKGVVYRSASPAVPLAEKVISTITTAFKSTFGLWLSLIIGIPVVFVFAIVSPIAAVIGGVVALIPAFYFGAISLTVLGGFAVLAGIVMHFLKRIG